MLISLRKYSSLRPSLLLAHLDFAILRSSSSPLQIRPLAHTKNGEAARQTSSRSGLPHYRNEVSGNLLHLVVFALLLGNVQELEGVLEVVVLGRRHEAEELAAWNPVFKAESYELETRSKTYSSSHHFANLRQFAIIDESSTMNASRKR